jgi:hypothetical protein
MANEIFYELYRKLSMLGNESSNQIAILNEIATVCRERKQTGSTPEEWLAEADDCLHEVAESPALFATAVSSWLTFDEDVLLGKALAGKASVKHLQHSTPVSYDLSNIDEARAILTGCRLCATYVTPAVSLGWALSLASTHPISDKTGPAVEHLLRYHAEEFPWTTRHLLASQSSPFKSLEKSTKVLTALEENETWLKSLPRLRELAMTTEMRLTLSSIKRRESRDIHRHASEKSFFSQLFTTQHFKYANKTSVEIVSGNQVHETTLEMSPYSVSTELPLSERTDPEIGAARRKALWQGLFQ